MLRIINDSVLIDKMGMNPGNVGMFPYSCDLYEVAIFYFLGRLNSECHGNSKTRLHNNLIKN